MTTVGSHREGVLLVNLGSPDSPAVRDVRRYLAEFLGDPRVLDMPAWQRWLLLHLVILPLRPRRSARAYSSIWTPRGSPLRVHGEALRDGVAKELGADFQVELAMRYGQPSIGDALERLRAAQVDRIVVLPLFPQYASSTTESAVERVREVAAALGTVPPLEICEPFFEHPAWVAAVAEVAREPLARFRPDFVLFSYHGLPERQIRKVDASGAHCLERPDCCAELGPANQSCYRAHCFATTRALARALDLEDSRHAVSFQSRLGRTPWIGPHTDHVLTDLARRGVRRLAVLCPSFVADCLETLEEIAIRGSEQWNELGGEALFTVPCPNADPPCVKAVASLVREGGSSGPRAPGEK